MRCRLALMACAAFDPLADIEGADIPQCSSLLAVPDLLCFG
jgi:hypothetical protein